MVSGGRFRSVRAGLARASVLLLVLGTGLAACDPCAGSTLCAEPRVSYDGRVRSGASGAPVPDAEVVITRTTGVQTRPDALVVRTDSLGVFRIRLEASEEGEVVVRLLIRGGGSKVEVEEVALRTSRSRGDVRWLGEWFIGPRPSASAPA